MPSSAWKKRKNAITQCTISHLISSTASSHLSDVLHGHMLSAILPSSRTSFPTPHFLLICLCSNYGWRINHQSPPYAPLVAMQLLPYPKSNVINLEINLSVVFT